MYLVGLTGGIGSGKSTVAAQLRDLGCEVIDADAVAREVVESGQPALVDLVERFGEGILQPDGALDRGALASLAFHDDASRRDLDRITHPRIGERVAARLEELRSSVEDPSRIVVVDHPLLIETGQAADYDAVVAVLAPVERRVARVRDGRGLDEADIRARMRAQTDDATRRLVARYVIDNDGSLDDLLRQVGRVHADLVRAARGRQP